jgi:DNA-binding NtrC family response regulator
MLVMGSRSSQIKPLHPASILAYPGQSASAALIRGLQSEPAFRKAGYRVQLVEDSAGLDNALKAGKYDVVVADVANANEMSLQVSLAASKPILLPVAFKASKEQQSAAQKRYHCLLKAPGNTENYLEAIDHAMELKLKGVSR